MHNPIFLAGPFSEKLPNFPHWLIRQFSAPQSLSQLLIGESNLPNKVARSRWKPRSIKRLDRAGTWVLPPTTRWLHTHYTIAMYLLTPESRKAERETRHFPSFVKTGSIKAIAQARLRFLYCPQCPETKRESLRTGVGCFWHLVTHACPPLSLSPFLCYVGRFSQCISDDAWSSC